MKGVLKFDFIPSHEELSLSDSHLQLKIVGLGLQHYQDYQTRMSETFGSNPPKLLRRKNLLQPYKNYSLFFVKDGYEGRPRVFKGLCSLVVLFIGKAYYESHAYFNDGNPRVRREARNRWRKIQVTLCVTPF